LNNLLVKNVHQILAGLKVKHVSGFSGFTAFENKIMVQKIQI